MGIAEAGMGDLPVTAALILLAIIAIFLLTRSKGKKKPAMTSVSGWRLDKWSKGVVLQAVGAGWTFVFPSAATGNVGYVQKFGPLPAGATQLRVRFRVTGGGFVPQEFPDGRPATVSLLLQRKDDNWQADARTRSYRWYSSTVQVLAAGEFEMVVPLEVQAWGDVYGGQDAELFAISLRELDNIGLVFGSAGGRGHGVYATQPSQFVLHSLEVT